MSSVIHISHPTKRIIGKINIPGSKSESNRLLIIKELYFPGLEFQGLSDSRDTKFLKQGLSDREEEKNIGDAGTAMRFLTAFYAAKRGSEIVLRGTERMHQRPLGVLVDALKALGAEIEYLHTPGYPPLRIKGQTLKGGILDIDSSVSSQFITALMLIAPSMERGLVLRTKGFSVSAPYIYLTADLMRKAGFKLRLTAEEIEIESYIPDPPKEISIEPDWTSASYWYLITLLASRPEIYLPGFKEHSLQGDSFVSKLFAPLGLDSHYIGSGFRLKKKEPFQYRGEYNMSLVHNPDLGQTMAVALAALNIPATIKGLQTLKIKETDRLEALKTELEKTGAEIETGEDFLRIHRGIQSLDGVTFDTWEDHRMAMSFAPLALLHPIEIRNPEVVAKSYQSFWTDLEAVGFQVQWL